MITRITGRLSRVLDEEARVTVGGLEYQVLVPEFVRRHLQMRVGHEVSLSTMHFMEGNPMQGKVVPRLLGFYNEDELEFFELFCTVDGVGTRKALKAFVRPVRDVAVAIQREDEKWLTSLPGIGAATARKIIATLNRKVARFTVLKGKEAPLPTADGAPAPAVVEVQESEFPAAVDGMVIEEIYQALMALGLSPLEARSRLDRLLTSGKPIPSVQDAIVELFRHS